MDYKQCYINARNTSTDSLSHVDNAYNGGRAYASSSAMNEQCYINARNTSNNLSHVDSAYNVGGTYASNARNTSNLSNVDNTCNVGGIYASSASYIERSLVQVTVTDFLQQKMA